jgi:hypothetical protein
VLASEQLRQKMTPDWLRLFGLKKDGDKKGGFDINKPIPVSSTAVPLPPQPKPHSVPHRRSAREVGIMHYKRRTDPYGLNQTRM